MPTIEEQKAELMRQIVEAGEDWWCVERLTIQGLQIYPDWFDAATRWQAACAELAHLATLDVLRAAQAALANPSLQNLQKAVETALAAQTRAALMLKANRLVRRLVDAQQKQ
jgi:hypothetical protein